MQRFGRSRELKKPQRQKSNRFRSRCHSDMCIPVICLDLLPAYKPYAFEFFLDRPSTKRCCTAALGQTPCLEHLSTIVQPSSWMSLLSPFLELSISSRMYRHFSRFDSFGWHFTLKVPPQQIIFAQCVFLWDQSCSLMIQVRYFSGLSIVNLIFLLYCASNDICVCNIISWSNSRQVMVPHRVILGESSCVIE